MSSALEIFDIVQTLLITIALVITIHFACFVYFKLLFIRPFSINYTFKLIVMNGITEFLSCLSYLLVYQLISYPFMIGFYTNLEKSGFATPLAGAFILFSGLGLLTSFFISLNRFKTIMFLRQQSNDSKFFAISLVLSFVFVLPGVLDHCFFTRVSYQPYPYGDLIIMLPESMMSNVTLRTISDVIRFAVSLATLIVNIILSILISRERQFIDSSDRQKFNGEKGLDITSIVSYAFYMLYFVNSMLARYFDNITCGYAQWLFLGFNAITPFWCLLLFTPSVRRMVFNPKRESTAITSFTKQWPR